MVTKKSDKLHSLFISFFYATLFFGDVSSGLQTQFSQVGLYFIGYALSLFLIEKRFNTTDYLLKRTTIDGSIKDKIIVSGEEIETEEEADVEENRFFRIIEQKNMINKKLFLVLYAVLFYFAVKASNGNFEVVSILPFFTAIMIIFSATIGHLLIALFFNALYFTMHVKETPHLFIVIYLVLFLLSLITFTMTSTHKEAKTPNKQIFLRNLLGGLIPLLSIVFVVNYFVSKPLDIFSYNKARELNHKAGKVAEKSKELAQNAAKKLKLSIPSSLSDSNNDNESMNAALANQLSKSKSLSMPKVPIQSIPKMDIEFNPHSNEKKSLQNNKTIIDTKDLLEKMGQSAELNEKDIEKLKDQLKNLKSDLSTLQNLDIKESGNESHSKNSEKNKAESKHLEAVIAVMEKELKSIQEQPGLKGSALKNIKDAIEAQAETPSSSTSPSTSESSKIDSKNFAATELGQNNQKMQQAHTIKPKKPTPPLMDEKLLKFIFNIFTALVIIGVILFVLNFINKFFKKTEYKDLETIIDNKEEEALLKSELNSLKKMKLGPKEEIMLYYEVIYKILKLYHFPDHEAPPPMEAYKQVKDKHLSIQKQLFNVTEIFCRSFYGNHPVTKEHLVSFRKSLLPVLINFGFKKKLF